MVARRIRLIAGSGLLAALVVTIGTGSAAAADCALSAPPYGNVGSPLAITGSGFPASTVVDISLSVEGGPSDAFTLESDANGALELSLTPEAIDLGVTTVMATAGTACTAQVVYTVLAAGATPPPAPADPGDSQEPAAPGTDTVAAGQGGSVVALWLLGAVFVAGGGVGLLMTRSTGRH